MKWSSIPKKEVIFSINDPPPCVSVNLKVQSFAIYLKHKETVGINRGHQIYRKSLVLLIIQTKLLCQLTFMIMSSIK